MAGIRLARACSRDCEQQANRKRSCFRTNCPQSLVSFSCFMCSDQIAALLDLIQRVLRKATFALGSDCVTQLLVAVCDVCDVYLRSQNEVRIILTCVRIIVNARKGHVLITLARSPWRVYVAFVPRLRQQRSPSRTLRSMHCVLLVMIPCVSNL